MFAISIDNNLELRLLMIKDAKIFYDAIEKNRIYLEKFMPRINENKSIFDSIEVIKIFINQLIQNNGFRVGIYYKNEFIGIIGLKYVDWRNKITEVMYWVDINYSGKGIATSCLKKIIDICFNYYGLNKIVLNASSNNLASQKVALKCGFQLESILKEEEFLSDNFYDIYRYCLIASQ
jgi:ribosomal-protein-serine acetyltransferase